MRIGIVYYCEIQRLSTFSFTFSLLYSVFVSRPGSSIFFAAAFPPAYTLSADREQSNRTSLTARDASPCAGCGTG